MNFDSKPWIESKVMAGVRFQVRKINERRRLKFNASMAQYNAILREIRAQRAPLDKEYRDAVEAAKSKRAALVASGTSKDDAEKQAPIAFADEKFRRWAELVDRERELDVAEMTPAMVRFGLVSIEGLEIDGKPATADLLIEDGPDDLYLEVSEAIAREFGLLPAEKENLPSPSISAAVVDGTASSTSAAPAEMPVTT